MDVSKLLRVYGSICGILSRGLTLAALKLMRIIPVISEKLTRIIACPKVGQISAWLSLVLGYREVVLRLIPK